MDQFIRRWNFRFIASYEIDTLNGNIFIGVLQSLPRLPLLFFIFPINWQKMFIEMMGWTKESDGNILYDFYIVNICIRDEIGWRYIIAQFLQCRDVMWCDVPTDENIIEYEHHKPITSQCRWSHQIFYNARICRFWSSI